MKKLSKAEAVRMFKTDELGHVPLDDKHALSQAWNYWTDMLCKNGEITMTQYETWTHPKISKVDWARAAVKACKC